MSESESVDHGCSMQLGGWGVAGWSVVTAILSVFCKHRQASQTDYLITLSVSVYSGIKQFVSLQNTYRFVVTNPAP